ncbi:hypothetical protein PG984_001522 [Apiospora sp. TS-2023a]
MEVASSTPSKSGTWRSKGTKGNNNAAANSSTQASKTLQQTPVPAPQTSTSYIPPPPIPATHAGTVAPSQVNGGGNKNKRTQLPPQNAAQDAAPSQEGQPSTPQVKASTISGAKRKRQPNKGVEATTNGNSTLDTTAQSTFPSQQPEIATVDAILGVNRQQNMSVESSGTPGPPGPPAKRARKSNSAAAKRQNAGAAAAATATASTENVAHAITSAVASPNLPQQPSQQSTVMPSQPMEKSLEPDYDHMSTLQARNEQNYQAHSIPAAPAEGLAAHYEQFTASMQNRQQSAQSSSSNHPQMQQMQQRQQQTAPQTVSPTPSQISKPPQMTTTMPSQQSTRAVSNAPNYYSQNQSPSYTTVQQGAYSSNPRQQHNMTTNSPGTTLVSHVTHSPQFGTQNNSPLMGAENSFRASPSVSSVHPNAPSYAPRRTTSASSMENPYRAASSAAHGVSTQSPHFGASRPTPVSSHSGVASFPSFSDQSLFDMQALDSSTAHNSMSMGGAGAYALGSSVQRTNSGSGATSYPNSAMTNGGYDTSGLNKSGINTGYRNRWS